MTPFSGPDPPKRKTPAKPQENGFRAGGNTMAARGGMANSLRILNLVQNCLQWGRSNLVDLAGSPKIRLLNRDCGNILSIFPRKNSKAQSSLNFL